MTNNEHREHMKEIGKLQSRIDDLHHEVRDLRRNAEAIQIEMQKARSLLEDLKKRWEAMDDDKA